MKKVRVRDFEAEREAREEQNRRMIECLSRPYPYNIPDFIPFDEITCYREIEVPDDWEVERKLNLQAPIERTT